LRWAVAAVLLVLLRLLPSTGAASAYAVWGWRIPFALGFALSAAVFVYYLRSVPESELWTRMVKQRRPLRTLFSGRHLRSVGLAFLVGTGAWLTLDATVGVFASRSSAIAPTISWPSGP